MAITPAQALELDLPISCDPGKNCFIQNYVDGDASTGVADFTCGKATYDGHKGVDFRLVSTQDVTRGIPVIAAADGIVTGGRDGMADRLFTPALAKTVKGRECGNGVVINHEDGWQTQYCHLRRGSVRVKRGARVKRGDHLGDVGFSGKAAFAHLHLSVRRAGKTIDPFTGKTPGVNAACTAGQPDGNALWSQNAGLKGHIPRSRFIESGFSGQILKPANSELGLARAAPLTRSSPTLLFNVRSINLQTGDRLRLQLSGPGGIRVKATTKAVSRHKATYAAFTGKRRRGTLWPPGVYRGEAAIIRGGKSVARVQQTLRLE